jgi:hypothetical protein
MKIHSFGSFLPHGKSALCLLGLHWGAGSDQDYHYAQVILGQVLDSDFEADDSSSSAVFVEKECRSGVGSTSGIRVVILRADPTRMSLHSFGDTEEGLIPEAFLSFLPCI